MPHFFMQCMYFNVLYTCTPHSQSILCVHTVHSTLYVCVCVPEVHVFCSPKNVL